MLSVRFKTVNLNRNEKTTPTSFQIDDFRFWKDFFFYLSKSVIILIKIGNKFIEIYIYIVFCLEKVKTVFFKNNFRSNKKIYILF